MKERVSWWPRFARSVSGVMILLLVAKGLGFAEKLALARSAGAGGEVDAYFTAAEVAFLSFVLIDDIVVPAFLPCYLSLRERDAPTATALLSWTLGAVCGGLVLLTGLAALFADAVVAAVAPGFEGPQASLASSLVRWVQPGGLALGLSALLYAVLNARGSFLRPAAASAAWKGAALVLLVLLLPVFGIRGAAMALSGGAVVQLLFYAGPLASELRSGTWGATPALSRSLRRMLLLMAPLAVGTLAAQCGGFVDNAVGSTLDEGSIAALGYARKIVDVPILLVPHVVGIVAFPALASLAAREDGEAWATLLGTLLGGCVLLLAPVAVGFFAAPTAVVEVLLRRGAFDARAVELTSTALAWFSAGLLAFTAEILVLRAYYSRQDTLTPIATGLVFVGVNIALTLTLAPRIGMIAVPVALVLQKTGKITVLLLWLTRSAGTRWLWALLATLRRGGPALCVFVVLFASLRVAIEQLGGGPWLVLAAAGGAGALYLGLLSRAGLGSEMSAG